MLATDNFLKNRIQKNTKKILISQIMGLSALSMFFSYQTYHNMHHDNDKKTPTSFINLFGTFCFFCYFGLSSTLLLSLKKNVKKTVTDDVLNQLTYPRSDICDEYAPLMQKDVEKLVTNIDFSNIDKKAQQSLLQDLIYFSTQSPFISKLLKNDMVQSKIVPVSSLSKEGVFSHNYKLLAKAIIQLKEKTDTCTLLHEILHSKQTADGAFFTKKLFPCINFINEAQAKTLDILLEYLKYQKENPNKNIHQWVSKILDYRFLQQQIKHPNLNHISLKYLAEKDFQVIMTKYLIAGSDINKKEDILNRYCPNVLSSSELLFIYHYSLLFNMSYENKKLKKFTYKYSNLENFNSKEVHLIPYFNSYYQANTDIPFHISEIKTTADNPFKTMQHAFQQLQKQ